MASEAELLVEKWKTPDCQRGDGCHCPLHTMSKLAMMLEVARHTLVRIADGGHFASAREIATGMLAHLESIAAGQGGQGNG